MKNKNILITGASRGIGKALKKLLEEEGANCITPNRDVLDVSSSNSIKSFFLKHLDCKLDGLVNNAGLNIPNPIDRIEELDIEKMFNTNLVGPLNILKFAAEHMNKSHVSRIVNLSSIWGLKSKENRSLYSVTKFGINGLTRSLAHEFGKKNILINSIAPGFVNTEMTKNNVSTNEQKKLFKQIPLNRFAEPFEIAKLILFLLSENNTYITGETITIDGGFLA